MRVNLSLLAGEGRITQRTRRVTPKDGSVEAIVQRSEQEARRLVDRNRRQVEVRLREVQAVIGKMTTEQMVLVLNMESFYKRNGYLGLHWYRQLGRMVRMAGVRV